jgi:hypothetical protein
VSAGGGGGEGEADDCFMDSKACFSCCWAGSGGAVDGGREGLFKAKAMNEVDAGLVEGWVRERVKEN